MAAAPRINRFSRLSWVIERNPVYLLSSLCVVIGVRMLLAPDETGAGLWTKIAATLGALQLYEWAICAVLIVLHRYRRAPEDLPSLLLIGAIFWTGPLVATMELSAESRGLGVLLAGTVAAVGVVEMQILQRALQLQLAAAVRFTAVACLVVLAGAQPLLKVGTDASATNEVLLYALWWVLAALLAGPALLDNERRSSSPGAAAISNGFLAITLAASAAHLVAMNRAFYGNMRAFYAAPVVAAAGVVAMRKLAAADSKRKVWLCIAAALPAAAIPLSLQRFEAHFPLETLPWALRNPMMPALALAALAWIYGFVLLRWNSLLHAAVLSLGALALLICQQASAPAGALVSLVWSDRQVGTLLYLLTFYLVASGCWRRSKATMAAGLIAHWIALRLLLSDSIPAEDMIRALTGWWTAFLVIHVAVPRAALGPKVIVVVMLVAATALFYRQPVLKGYAAAHGIGMVVVLAAWGWLRPATRYMLLAGIAAALEVLPLLGMLLKGSRLARAGATVASGFALLLVGAWVSWNKRRLLTRLRRAEADPLTEPTGPA